MSNHIDADTFGDHTTLTDVLEGYRSAGYAGDFFVTADAQLECGGCRSMLDPTRLGMVSLRRLEGVSDPADMVSVVCTTCPVCGQDGTVVLGFGPMATDVDSQVFSGMQDRRMDEGLPAAGAPDEMPDA